MCFWCGEDAPTSKDHVFPRNLSRSQYRPRSYRSRLPLACATRGVQQDEEYFRDFVVGASYRDPDARKIWDEKTLRALQRSPRYREMLARDVSDVDYRTRGGLFLGAGSAGAPGRQIEHGPGDVRGPRERRAAPVGLCQGSSSSPPQNARNSALVGSAHLGRPTGGVGRAIAGLGRGVALGCPLSAGSSVRTERGTSNP